MLSQSPTQKFDFQIILKFGKTKISQETCITFLGVLLDSNLSWKSYIIELSKKLSRTGNTKTSLPWYISSFYFIWHSSLGLNLQILPGSIFVLQKNYYLSDITSPSTPIFCELNLLTLYDIHNLPVAFFVSECVNGLSPSYFHEYFKLTSSKHIIRTCQFTIGNLFLERRNTDQYGIWSIQCYGVILWNSIPPEIRNFDIYCMCSVQIENTLYFSVYCVR